MRRILLIEDNKAQARAGTEFLEGIGYSVAWAADGKTAIKMAATEAFDLALLDLVLPDMHGNQICKWFKGNPATRNMPVIMLTAKGSVADLVSGLESGADDYLHKPYEEQELKARIHACLRTKGLQDELAEKNRQLEELLREVETLAITDPLTGLYNRRHFTKMLDVEYERLVRYGRPLACMMIDADHFKRINDTHGHAAGDAVLAALADIFRATLRKADIIARWGGEEFVVLMPETPCERAAEAAERVRGAVGAHKFPKLGGKGVTVSIGLSCSPEVVMQSPEMIVDTADQSLYQAKQQGRNRVVVFGPDESVAKAAGKGRAR